MAQGVEFLFIGAVLLLLSILASKASGRLGVPALVLFIMIGMLAGSDGIGGIKFDYPFATQILGVVALVFILFSGGFDTDLKVVRPIMWQGIALSTAGVLITAILVGCFAYFFIDLSFIEGLLLGSIVSSTDVAAVFGTLRSQKTVMRNKLKTLIEFESASNDPTAVFLTLFFINLLQAKSFSIIELSLMFFLQIAVAIAAGFAMGKFIPLIFNKLKLEYAGLYPVLSIALILFTYGVTTLLQGNGFLAVYITGLIMGKTRFTHKENLSRFHDGIVWLMQIAMFLVLGLQVYPSELPTIFATGIFMSIFLIFVARPVAVASTLSFFGVKPQEQAMIAWAGLRGAVAIILATFPILAHLPRAQIIFNMVFFIVFTSVLLQGVLVPYMARWLKVEK